MRAALALLLFASTAHAQPDDAKSKKDRFLASKTANKKPVPKPGKKPAPLVNLYNTWTHEWLAVEPGKPPRAETANRFLRDHFTNKPSAMEPKLVEILMSAAATFQSDLVMVVSAFRHPKYNLILRKKGHQVARDSQHTRGNAVDFYLPKVTTQQLHAWAKDQALGGVGLYLDSGFVHMDTGKIRYWSGE